jgi:cyanophycinase
MGPPILPPGVKGEQGLRRNERCPRLAVVSIHLVGGGRDDAAHLAVYGPFVAEAVHRGDARGRAVPTVGLVVVHQPDDPTRGAGSVVRFSAALDATAPVTCLPIVLTAGAELEPGRLGGLDGLVVAGGLTPAYATALRPVAEEIRALVADGMPYLGFSAGAAVAARRALVGGYRQDGVVVCHPDNGEDLDELTVVDGLGLVDVTVDVHAAQWGNVSRLIAAVRSGAVRTGVAVDEDTVLVVEGATTRTAGAGRLWWVSGDGGGLTVRLEGAGL